MKSYIAIDLKSFLRFRGVRGAGNGPLGTNLVVADESRTEKDHLPGGVPGAEGLWNTGSPGFSRWSRK